MQANKPYYIIITPFFPSPETWRGGYCFDFVKALVGLGRYNVVVFRTGAKAPYKYKGVSVYPINEIVNPSGVLNIIWQGINNNIFIRTLDGLGISVDKVAVVHAYTNNYVRMGYALKKLNPHILLLAHHHDCASFGISVGRLRHFYPLKLLNFFLARHAHEMADIQVYISQRVKQSFESFPDTSWTLYQDYKRISWGLHIFSQVKVKDSYILHNGVDVDVFSPVVHNRTEVFKIGCVANFVELKNHITLLKALKKIDEKLGRWEFVCVGSGPTLEKCRKFVCENSLQDKVKFMKEIDHLLLPDFYRSMDLIVLASCFEGFGCVLAEAWSCGTPFIASRGLGIDDLFLPNNREKWLCDPFDVDEWADKILSFSIVRPEQELDATIDIKVLVKNFIDYIEAKRSRTDA